MAFLTPEDHNAIRSAVAEAEAHTGGEIVTAIIEESDDYMAAELRFSLFCGILVFLTLSLLAHPIEALIDRWYWIEAPSFVPLFIGVVTLLISSIVYQLSQIPAIDRLIIGKKAMKSSVRHRALRYFVESGCYGTVDRTGVLLFVSVLERRVELIFDKGINSLIPKETIDPLVHELITGLKNNKRGESLVKAIRRLGDVLKEYVPRREDDVNELSDGPAELEKGS